MAPKFAIHVIGLNRLELTKKCVGSIMAFSKPNSYHLILTDNGSTDETRDYFLRLQEENSAIDITVIPNDTNEGFIAPNNFAFEMADRLSCQYYIALNNDTEVCDSWLEMLAAPLDSDPLGALSGPQGTCRTLRDNMDGYDGDILDYIEGSCLCAKIEIVSKQGSLFSDYLDFIYGDDSDLSLRMREAGYHIYQVPFRIKHVQCATTHDPAVKERCHQAQLRNHEVGMKRWAFYLKHRHFNYPLVVKRKHAIGDVILTTPAIALMKEAMPDRPIWVETDFPQVFENNPNVEKAQVQLTDMDDAYPLLDLNGAYEKRKNMAIGDCYMLEMASRFPKTLGARMDHPHLFPSDGDRQWAIDLAKNHQFSPKICIIHADKTWPGKTWPIERFSEIATWLVGQGFHVVAIGEHDLPSGFDAFSLIRSTSLLQLADLMSMATLFVGGDSAPLHVALARCCPTVALFGVTSSKYIVHGSGPRFCLDAQTESAGARHRMTGLEFTDLGKDAIESHSVEDVKEAVRKLGVL